MRGVRKQSVNGVPPIETELAYPEEILGKNFAEADLVICRPTILTETEAGKWAGGVSATPGPSAVNLRPVAASG